MGRNDAVDNGHSQSGPPLSGGKEGFKNAVTDFGRHSGTIIADGDADGGMSIKHAGATLYVDNPFIAAGHNCVFQNVLKDLFHTMNVNITPAGFALQVFNQIKFTMFSKVSKIIPFFSPCQAEVMIAEFQMNWSSVTAHFFIQTMQILQCRFGSASKVQLFQLILEVQSQHIQARLGTLQSIAAFMSEASNHLSDGSESF
jgi:hypothetical protein